MIPDRLRVLLVALVALQGAAYGKRNEKRAAALAAYPLSEIERPLTLPSRMVRLTGELHVTSTESIHSLGATTPGFAGFGPGLGIDVGLPHRLQIGAFVATGLPALGGLLLGNVQVGLARALSLRFDLGFQGAAASAFGNGGSDAGAVIGVGLPVKIRLARSVAFISGSSAARGFGAPSIPTYAGGGISAFAAAVTESTDLLTVFAGKNGIGSTTTNPVFVSMFLPAGLLFQPHRRVSLALRTGYRMIVDRKIELHYVPVGAAVQVSATQRFDVGVSAHLDGYVGATHARVAARYADTLQLVLWLGGRL